MDDAACHLRGARGDGVLYSYVLQSARAPHFKGIEGKRLAYKQPD